MLLCVSEILPDDNNLVKTHIPLKKKNANSLSYAGTENGLPQRSAKKISIYVHASLSKCRTKS